MYPRDKYVTKLLTMILDKRSLDEMFVTRKRC